MQIILFIMTYLIVFIIYKFLFKRKTKKNKKPMEVEFLIKKYKIDLKKINYKKLLNNIALVSALDITLVVSIIAILNSFLLSIIFGVILPIPLILISYNLIGKYYQKEGMIKDE